jgi:hypothetical protein
MGAIAAAALPYGDEIVIRGDEEIGGIIFWIPFSVVLFRRVWGFLGIVSRQSKGVGRERTCERVREAAGSQCRLA